MQASNEALLAAFNRSKLPSLGFTFDKAIAMPMFKRCLEHMAQSASSNPSNVNKRDALPAPKWRPAKPRSTARYWWHLYD